VAVQLIPELNFVLAPASYLLFHNSAEFFSVMVSLSMFGIGWYTYDQSKNRHALFLSTAFLGIGLMDFMHTLANAAMPPFVTPNSTNKSTQFWIAVRLFQAVAFLVSAYVYSERPGRWMSRKVLLTSALLVSFLVFTAITFFPAYMPPTFVPGIGLTAFKKISEYLVIGLLCAAAAAYWRRIASTGDRVLIYYLAAFVICIFSELSLAVYTKVFDTYNVLGHIYKVAAFFLIYYGIYRASVKAPYLRLTEVSEKLKEENQERVRTEQSLRLEEARLDALLHLTQISEAPLKEISGFTLEQAIGLTHSKIGFVGFLNEDESVYTLHAVSKDVVKECNVTGDPLQWHVVDAGIWADAIRERKTLFENDYSKPDPRKRGLPRGHPYVERFMVVPILEGEKIVAVAGVGNKASAYDKSDERQIVLLLSGMWGCVQKNRSREELQKAYNELEEKVEQRTAELAASTVALQESQKDLNRAQEVGQIGSWRLDVRRNVLTWSDETRRMFDVPKGIPLTYETFLGLVHPEDRHNVDTQWKAALAGEPYDIEHRIVVGGQVKWVREKAYLEFDDADKLLGGFGIAQDITERKQMEEELRKSRDQLDLRVRERTAELELRNKELQDFAFVASHDLQEPLRKVRTFGDMLAGRCGTSLDEASRDYLRRMQTAAARMRNLLNSLLAFSRLTTKAEPMKETDLGKSVEVVLSNLEIMIKEKNACVEVGDLPTVRADRVQMVQLFQNLIGNALKFQREGKTPHVKVYAKEGGDENGAHEICVRDNGIGFEEKYLDKIFLPFQRLHGSSSAYEGVGMGLAICKKIVERHDGKITARSEVGKGSTFIVTLPA
jgi:PAS domain S-box-containing protein